MKPTVYVVPVASSMKLSLLILRRPIRISALCNSASDWYLRISLPHLPPVGSCLSLPELAPAWQLQTVEYSSRDQNPGQTRNL